MPLKDILFYLARIFKINHQLLILRMMQKELSEIVHLKNSLIVRQSKRISMLEEKLTELRHKYFRLKYDDEKNDMHLQQSRKY